jgi:hypothetical protein
MKKGASFDAPFFVVILRLSLRLPQIVRFDEAKRVNVTALHLFREGVANLSVDLQ